MSDPSSDFFRYGRGYALYSQGMTDVGRLLVDNARGDSERIQAAVDRDTLQIAKAAGQGLTLDEYKNLHEKVEFLHSQYVQGKLTESMYQEKLWSLPGSARSGRGATSPTHYKPTRDKSGKPVAKQPGANLVPTEKMKKLAPEMAELPPINFADFWKSVQEKAGVEPEAPAARPPGDGNVPRYKGAPPLPAKQGGGMLDQIQAGLDAVGIVEPTPFADGINAGISAVRALTDRENAGEHLRNAGISLISMFPYVGDVAKIGKYGGKVSNQSRGGKLVNSLAPFLGMAGGSGGGGGSVPPCSSHYTGGGGMGGAGGNLLDSIAGGFGNLAKAMGPVGFALAGTILGLQKFVRWLGNVDQKSRKMIEDNRGLAQYSGGLAGSYAQLNNERLLREINKAQELSGPLGRLTKSQSGFEAAQEDLLLPFKQLAVDIQALTTQVATYAIKVIDYLEPISELLHKWYGDENDKKGAKNVVDYLAREANERKAKRKLKR